MARSKKHVSAIGGPFLASALFCENVVQDKDNTITLVRIIDKFTVQLPANMPPGFPSKENPLPVNISGLITFRTGDARGKHEVRLIVVSPTGKKAEILKQVLNSTAPPLILR
jgi:hypothetical protein